MASSESILRPAVPADLPEILALLEIANLPVEGVADHLPGFLIAEFDACPAACGGLERYGAEALLRSVAVRPAHRRSGLGNRIVKTLIETARREGIRTVVLLTTTAAGYFPRFGFESIDRSAVPESLRRSAELRGACPSTATAMRLELRRG
ncbi:MAG: arsenic resistance N-acetyltransferase ArsN2 [Thermoanaerobaculia bacterium]